MIQQRKCKLKGICEIRNAYVSANPSIQSINGDIMINMIYNLDVAEKYQESLTYFGNMDFETQERLIEEIITDIERYRSLVDQLIIQNDKDFALDETKKFNSYLKLFDSFMESPTPEPEPDTVDIDMLLGTDSSRVIDPQE